MNDTNSRSDLPKYAVLPRACAITGLGRSKIYELAATGKLRLIKAGSRTLLDVDHALAWMATLPKADITPPRKAERA